MMDLKNVCLLQFRSSYSLRYNNVEIRPTNNLIIASKISRLRCLTLNQKLEMITLGRKACSKLRQAETVNHTVIAKENF